MNDEDIIEPALQEALDDLGSERMPEAVRQQLREGLWAATEPGGDGGGGGGGGTGAGSSLSGGAIAAAALVALGVGGGVWFAMTAPDAPAHSTQPTRAHESPVPEDDQTDPVDRDTQGTVERSAERADPVEPNTELDEPTSIETQPAPAPVAPTRRESITEIELLDEAQAQLSRSPRRTLTLVQRHARRFPAGQLVPEREVLRVDALRRLGRREEARIAADRFLRTHPNSSQRHRVEQVRTELAEDTGG